MRVRLTDRDLRLLRKCAAARWLSTSQILRLFFSRASPHAVRKRLRKLASAGYVRSHQPHRMSEALHTVGTNGKRALAVKGIDVTLEREPPRQREHLVGINDLRVRVERDLAVRYFFAAWEVGRLGWTYPVIPDAVFGIAGGKQRIFVVEYDRGTESVTRFIRKLLSYREGLDGFSFEAVLVVTDTVLRLAHIGLALRKRGVPLLRYLGTPLAAMRQYAIGEVRFVDLGDETKKTHALLSAG